MLCSCVCNGHTSPEKNRWLFLFLNVWIIWPTSASQITVERIGSIQIDKNFITQTFRIYNFIISRTVRNSLRNLFLFLTGSKEHPLSLSLSLSLLSIFPSLPPLPPPPRPFSISALPLPRLYSSVFPTEGFLRPRTQVRQFRRKLKAWTFSLCKNLMPNFKKLACMGFRPHKIENFPGGGPPDPRGVCWTQVRMALGKSLQYSRPCLSFPCLLPGFLFFFFMNASWSLKLAWCFYGVSRSWPSYTLSKSIKHFLVFWSKMFKNALPLLFKNQARAIIPLTNKHLDVFLSTAWCPVIKIKYLYKLSISQWVLEARPSRQRWEVSSWWSSCPFAQNFYQVLNFFCRPFSFSFFVWTWSSVCVSNLGCTWLRGTEYLKEREAWGTVERKKWPRNLPGFEPGRRKCQFPKWVSNSIHHGLWLEAQSKERSLSGRNAPASNPGRSLDHVFRSVIPRAYLSFITWLYSISDTKTPMLSILATALRIVALSALWGSLTQACYPSTPTLFSSLPCLHSSLHINSDISSKKVGVDLGSLTLFPVQCLILW